MGIYTPLIKCMVIGGTKERLKIVLVKGMVIF